MTYIPTIERGIPVPQPRGGRAKYPWRDMQVGDSFYIEASSDKRRAQRAVSNCAVSAGRRIGAKFSTRFVDGGIRVWRVS